MSRNYKVDSPFGSIQSNVICNESTPIAKEVMMKTTLKVFDSTYDIFEVWQTNIFQCGKDTQISFVETFKHS